MASATVEKNGAHSSAAPISSKTTASSDMVAPAPPNCSGTAMPFRPSSPAIWRHTARVVALLGGHEFANPAAGEATSRKSRTACRSSSASLIVCAASRCARPDPG